MSSGPIKKCISRSIKEGAFCAKKEALFKMKISKSGAV
jgi:hypothetical protein